MHGIVVFFSRTHRRRDIRHVAANVRRQFGISDRWGKLMASESHFAAVRPLLFAAAWFVILAGAAFAWAAVENQNTSAARKAPSDAMARLAH